MATSTQEILEILDRVARNHEIAQQEMRERMKESDRRLSEADRQRQETDRQMQETARRMSETDRQMQATDRKLKEVTEAIGRLGNRLGEFVEEMVRSAAVRLFRERGIDVHQVFRRAFVERDGESMEIDLLVVNTTDAILIEAKSELKTEDVREHIDRLERFKRLCPQYSGFRVMGAVAAMVVPDSAARFAYRQGLYVLAQSGDTVTIRNDAAFQPGIW